MFVLCVIIVRTILLPCVTIPRQSNIKMSNIFSIYNGVIGSVHYVMSSRVFCLLPSNVSLYTMAVRYGSFIRLEVLFLVTSDIKSVLLGKCVSWLTGNRHRLSVSNWLLMPGKNNSYSFNQGMGVLQPHHYYWKFHTLNSCDDCSECGALDLYVCTWTCCCTRWIKVWSAESTDWNIIEINTEHKTSQLWTHCGTLLNYK